MGLVTNGARHTQQRKLEALGIEEYFDATVFATPEEALKPDPDPFHWALEEMGVPPNRAVHVGDSLESDVKGAEAAGVRSVWLTEDGVDATPATEPSYVIRSLAELRPPPWNA